MATAPSAFPVESLIETAKTLEALLDAAGEPSLRIAADEVFRKSLVLGAASYFEAGIAHTILSFAADASSDNSRLEAFIERKALARQFHTLFDWDARNANRFFQWFGDEFLERAKAAVAHDPSFGIAIDAFLELGSLRNRLVHGNFAAATLDKTLAELSDLFARAREFPGLVATLLRDPTAV